ncbi:tumor necrosis factor receptor superfamily member 1B isoform X1 [Chelmon rostratus]|uniref:tumor necrosis factor receptor superfamily member 1B isoform X1 n=1 Tax=Chelmon rostratus TaxID=109905 RepID=UPI001BEA2899|nr:tumor necrosis factor receptor superfamily member 1B isoform X1 [Chelmon rostratus]
MREVVTELLHACMHVFTDLKILEGPVKRRAIVQVCSLPYQTDSDGNCNSSTEYLLDGSNLCCKKCLPGHRLKQTCSETTEAVCEQCPAGQYMEGTNYSPNCFSCNKCKSVKGLREVQNCSPTTRSKCGCQSGMYCIMGFDDPFCSECSKYKQCRVGYGVSVPGTADSDVKCERCPDGTFSDSVSSMDRCRPHTNCHGRVVVKKGDATSDTECESEVLTSSTWLQNSTEWPHIEILLTTASTVMSTVSATSDSKTPRGVTDSTPTFNSLSEATTKNPPHSTVSDGKLAAIIISCIGVPFIAIIVLFCWRTVKKDAARFHPKVDANGNCETGDKISQSYLGAVQQTSFTVTSPEQQCLLEKAEANSDQSGCDNIETLTRTDDCSSYNSIGPLQSTIAREGPHSDLSEPMTLLSNTEPVAPQTSIPTQCSSQPTSPQIISPVTTSPHVNVNITFHIGNGSGGTPSAIPSDFMHVNSKPHFVEEEESFSIPQQEAGKQSLMSVQESSTYSA